MLPPRSGGLCSQAIRSEARPEARAELSWRIAKLRGFIASSEEGRAEGLLLDVAELWELFVVNCVRRAIADGEVEHGTTARSQDLYQLASYLSRFAADGRAPGALFYPLDPEQARVSSAEARGPWRTAAGNAVRFVRVALDPSDAIAQLAAEAPVLLAG